MMTRDLSPTLDGDTTSSPDLVEGKNFEFVNTSIDDLVGTADGKPSVHAPPDGITMEDQQAQLDQAVTVEDPQTQLGVTVEDPQAQLDQTVTEEDPQTQLGVTVEDPQTQLGVTVEDHPADDHVPELEKSEKSNTTEDPEPRRISVDTTHVIGQGGLGDIPVFVEEPTAPIDEMLVPEEDDFIHEEILSVDVIPELVDEPVPPMVVSSEMTVFDTEKIFMLAKTNDFSTIEKKILELESWEQIIDARDLDGHTVLHWACLFGNIGFVREACKQAISQDGWINCTSRNGQTAFMWASLKGHVECMRCLYHEYGACISSFDSLRADAGILSVQHHQHNAMLLIHKWRSGSAFDHADNMGCTAAHWAAYKGDITAVRILEYMGTNMNAVDNCGMTPLHRAVGEGWNEVAIFLVLKCNADVDAKNGKGESVIDIARRLENKNLLVSLAMAVDKRRQHSQQQIFESRTLFFNTLDDPDTQYNWILPIIFVVCMSIVVLSFISDFSIRENSKTNFGSIFFIACVSISIMTFSFLVTGDAGVVVKRMVGRSAIEELIEDLDNPIPIGDTQSLNRICFTCWEWKTLRTKHCSVCDVCVDGFDHHCGWLNNCVAEKNHRPFVVMVLATFFGSLMYLILTINAFWSSETASLWTIWYEKPFLIPGWIINGAICPWLGLLVFYQLRSIAMNMNTNEMINMHRYEHFWEGPLTVKGVWAAQIDGIENEEPHIHENGKPCNHHHGDGHEGSHQRRFKNPFDQGSAWRNCVQFWTQTTPHQGQGRRRRGGDYQSVMTEIELAEYV